MKCVSHIDPQADGSPHSNQRSTLTFIIFSFFLLFAGPALALPDWTLAIEDPGQDGLPAGSTIVYEVEIRNDAVDPADSAPATTITFDVHPGTMMVDGGGLLNCMVLGVADASVTCDVPEIPANGSETYFPKVTSTVGGTSTFAGSIPTADDSFDGNNSAFQETTLTIGADIELELTGPATASSGAIVDYTFTATNNGPNTSNGFEIEFPAPAGLQNLVAPANCVFDGANYVCTIPGDLLDGESATIEFSGQITSGDGSNIGLSGAVGDGTPGDGVSGNNIATMGTTVSAGSDVSIGKTISETELLEGDTAIFTLSSRFTGDDPQGLLLTDVIPSNYSVIYPIDVSGTGWDCSDSVGNSISCSQANGGSSGANVSLGNVLITVSVDTNNEGMPLVENTASISSSGPVDPNLDNNTDGDNGVNIEAPFVDHRINKSGPDPLLVALASEYEFVLSSTNLGNADFTGTLTIEDTLPVGMTLNSLSAPDWTCSPTTPLVGDGVTPLVCNIVYTAANPLLAGARSDLITTVVEATTTGSLSNLAEVSASNANYVDDNVGNDEISVTSTGFAAGDSADVELTKTAVEASLLAGEIQTFTIEVLNNGTASGGAAVDAQGVEISDTIFNLINNTVGPDGGIEAITLNQAGTDLGCTTAPAGNNGVAFDCAISVLPACSAGSCPTIEIQARPGGNPGSRKNTASVITRITADSGPNNNTATVPYEVTGQTDVTVAKTVTPNPVIVGQDTLYIITAENKPMVNGAPVVLSAAQNVTVTDNVPDDMTFVSVSASGGGTCTASLIAGDTTSGDTISCSWGSINNNGQQSVNLVLRPNMETLNNPPLMGGTAPGIVNDVAITTSTVETDTTNNGASAPVEITDPQFDLLANKSDDVDPVAVAEAVTYTVQVQNAGPSAAENVTVVDQMPPSGLAFDSFVDPIDGSCSVTNAGTPAVNSLFGNVGVEVTCVIPYLEAGTSTTFDILAIGDGKGSVTNNVSLSAQGSADYESNTDNDTTSQVTNVRTRVDVRVNSKTASASPVNLAEGFFWTIEVENQVGGPMDYYGQADGTILSDSLPTGMVLTGPPVAVGASFADCSGVAGDTSFSCTLGNDSGLEGSMSIGEVIQISVPVRVEAITSDGQSFDNTATVDAADSFDANSPTVGVDNNFATGQVAINAGSISGEIFRDFDDDGVIDTGDTTVNDVTMTLAGEDLNGNMISRTVTTTNGTYSFDLLAEGEYVVTRGTVDEAYQTAGKHIPGTGGTPIDTTTVSPTIVLAGNEDASGYDFAVIPQARIGLAKQAFTPVLNADGTVTQRFGFVIENFSLEELNSVSLEDQLSGPADLFGTYTTAADVASGMARGEYTISTAPSSDCGGALATFTGHGAAIEMVSGGTIAAGESCIVEVSIRINPTDPSPSSDPKYLNSATVDGVGTLSGQTSVDNPLLSDVSDNGSDPDVGNDGSGDGANESDPTPVSPDLLTNVLLEKSVNTSAIADSSAPVAGEVLTYTYTVTNPTDFNVLDIDVTENAPGPQAANSPPNFSGTGTPPTVGVPTGGTDIDGQADLPDLAPNSTMTYTATYVITQADINTGSVLNTASLTATDVYGGPLTDFSDDPVVGGEDYNSDDIPDDPTVTTLPRVVRLEVAKTIPSESLSSPFLLAGDTVDYEFIVTNTGNTDVAAVTPADPGPQFGGVPATGAALVFATSDVTDLGPSEFATFTATYTLTAADVDNFYTAPNPSNAVVNVADAEGTPPPGTTLVTVTDTSETGADPAPDIELTKAITAVNDANGNGILGDAGDVIVYDLTVMNKGYTSLADVRITDAAIDLNNAPLTSPTAGANLASGDTGAIKDLSYTITPLNLAEGNVVNTAIVTSTAVATNTDGTPDASTPLVDGTGTQLADVVDTSDTLTDPKVGAPAEFELTVDPAADGGATPTVLNLPAIEAGITITKRVDGVADTNGNGLIGDAEDIITYTLVVTNSGNTSLADVLVEDAILGLSQNIGDLAIDEVFALPGLEYMITIENQADRTVVNTAKAAGDPVETGPDNVPDPSNPLVDGAGADLDDVTDLSDTLTDPELDGDGNVTDVADPSAGGSVDDPTTVNLPATTPAITLVKSITSVVDVNGNGLLGDVGDQVLYELVVTNTGNTALAGVAITDAKLGLTDEAVVPGDLAPAASATLTPAAYTITPDDQAAGSLENTATTTGAPIATGADGLPDAGTPLVDGTGTPLVNVDDTSDTRTDPELDGDGNVVITADPDADGDDDAPTVLTLPEVVPAITLVKSITSVVDVNDDLVLGNAGDTINYKFVVTNTGNTSLINVTISDPLLSLVDVPTTPDFLVPDESSTLDAVLEITRQMFADGFVENTATTSGTVVATAPDGTPDPATPVVGIGGNPLPDVTDISDTGSNPYAEANGTINSIDDPANEGTPDDPTVINIPLVPSPLFISGTVFLDKNRDGVLDGSDAPTAGARYTVRLLDADGDVIATTVTDENGLYHLAGFPTGTYTVAFIDPDGGDAGTLGPFVFDHANQSYTDVNMPIVVVVNDGSFTLVKTANVEVVIVGQTVTYDITASNLSATAHGPVTITDTLPAGLAYTPDSATLDGVAVTPNVSGQTISVPNVTLPGDGSVILSLQVRVLSSAPPGDITNIADLIDGLSGIQIAATATAVIRRRIEAVFQCSDIIGKVFDDVDRDGYQGGLENNNAAITNQDIFTDGKLSVAPIEVSRAEPGLLGVRLVTTDGTIITTDAYGRYSVPCAALPGAIGENFTLKLDPNSLPTGYRVTTENPRTMRVTAGIMTEMNFGASIGRVVDIDLTATAFDADHELSIELLNGLDVLLAQVRNTPSIVRITYFTNGESAVLAIARLDALEDVIREKWRRIGNYRLAIERTVTRLQ